ncbi:MAG: copper amine oxidase N-terminal domain-containing protein [Candidatus Baltobacteraceae bacterium]
MRYQPPSKRTLLTTAGIAIVAALTFALAKPVEMRVDGQPLISDVPPVTSVKGAVFVPLRPVGDALGADTAYDRKSGEIVVTRGDQILRLRVGSIHAKLNGMPMTLKQPPFRVRGRVMLGLRAMQRAFGVRVKFDKMTARVEVDTPGLSSTDSRFQTQ